MLSSFLLSQILVFFAIIADIISFQYKDRKKILICFIISAILIGIHYALLERFDAFLLIMISAIRYGVGYFSTNKNFLFLFLGISTLISYWFFQDRLDYIIYIANIIGVLVAFQKQDRYLRLLAMCGISLNILYNYLIFSPMGVLTEGIFLWSNIVGYWKYYIKK